MTYICTCHTENCENKDIAVELIDPTNIVICGPCGQEITDKVNLNTETTQE